MVVLLVSEDDVPIISGPSTNARELRAMAAAASRVEALMVSKKSVPLVISRRLTCLFFTSVIHSLWDYFFIASKFQTQQRMNVSDILIAIQYKEVPHLIRKAVLLLPRHGLDMLVSVDA